MLDIFVTVKVIWSLVEVVALHDIIEEILDQFTVFFGLVQISNLHRSISLSVTGWIRISKICQIVPMLGNLTTFIKAEDVKSDLLTSTGKIIDCLQEHLVTILKSTDVVHSCFNISRCKIFHGADKSIRTSAVCQIVLDVAISQQAAGGVRISGSKGVDERQRLFCLALFLLNKSSLLGAFFSRCFRSGILGAASSQDCSAHGNCQRKRKNFFHFE